MKKSILLLLMITLSLVGCGGKPEAPVAPATEAQTEISTDAVTEAFESMEPTEVKDPKIIEAIVRMDNGYTESLFKGDFDRALSYFYRQDDSTSKSLKNTIDYFTQGKITEYTTLDALDVKAYTIKDQTFYMYKLEVVYTLEGVTTTDITSEDSCAIMNDSGEMLRVLDKDTGIATNLLDTPCVTSQELVVDSLVLSSYVDQTTLKITGINRTSDNMIPEGEKNWTRYAVELLDGEVYDFNGNFKGVLKDESCSFNSLMRDTYGNDITFEDVHDRINFVYVRDIQVNGKVKDLLLYSAGDSQAKFDQKQAELISQ